MAKQILVKVPDDLYDKVLGLAEQENYASIQELIRELLRRKLRGVK